MKHLLILAAVLFFVGCKPAMQFTHVETYTKSNNWQQPISYKAIPDTLTVIHRYFWKKVKGKWQIEMMQDYKKVNGEWVAYGSKYAAPDSLRIVNALK